MLVCGAKHRHKYSCSVLTFPLPLWEGRHWLRQNSLKEDVRHCNLLHFSNHANSYNPSQNFWWRIWKCRHILGCGKSFNSWRRLFHLSFLGSLFKVIWDPQIQTLTLTLFLNSTLHKLICLPKIFQMTNHGCCHILGCEKSCISARAGGRSHFFFKGFLV